MFPLCGDVAEGSYEAQFHYLTCYIVTMNIPTYLPRYRPYYLHREFSSVSVIAVYIPPDTNLKNALHELYGVISSHMKKQPEGVFILIKQISNLFYPNSTSFSTSPQDGDH